MLKYISNIINSDNPNLTILKIAVILAIILAYILIYRLTEPPNTKKQEGFTQKEQFVLKQNQDVYDDFYAEVYDGLNDAKNRYPKELIEIIKMTEPSTKNSTFLDVGRGTGYMVNELQEAGHRVYVIDKSKDMIDYAEKVNPDAIFKNGDVMEPMVFDKMTFTHVLCTNFTIYLFEDKLTFFRNCYYWMIPNGYLIVHLVEPTKFNLNVQTKDNSYATLFNSNAPIKRKTEANVNFYDFKYAASYKFPNNNNNNNNNNEKMLDHHDNSDHTDRTESSCSANCVTFKETFVDHNTKHIRQNEQNLYMNKIDDILALANKAGFIFHGKTNMKDIHGDENQDIYIFERPM